MRSRGLSPHQPCSSRGHSSCDRTLAGWGRMYSTARLLCALCTAYATPYARRMGKECTVQPGFSAPCVQRTQRKPASPPSGIHAPPYRMPPRAPLYWSGCSGLVQLADDSFLALCPQPTIFLYSSCTKSHSILNPLPPPPPLQP